MRKPFIAAMFLMSLSGCATTHEWCMDHLDRYRDYDQCYADRDRKVAAAKKGWHDAFSPKTKQVNCTSNAYGNTTYTSCR